MDEWDTWQFETEQQRQIHRMVAYLKNNVNDGDSTRLVFKSGKLRISHDPHSYTTVSVVINGREVDVFKSYNKGSGIILVTMLRTGKWISVLEEHYNVQKEREEKQEQRQKEIKLAKELSAFLPVQDEFVFD